MKALAHNPLPLATTSAFTPRSSLPDFGGKLAWRDAFHRATKEADFVLSLPRGATQVHDSLPHALGAQHADRALPTHAGWHMPERVDAEPHLASDAPPPGYAAGCTVSAASGGDVAEDAEPTSSMPSQRRFARPLEERAPVRVHVEQRADGTAVWLGCDARVPAAHLAALLAAIKTQFAAAPIAAIVCNGTPLHPRTPRSQETP